MGDAVVRNESQLATAVADMDVDRIFFAEDIELTDSITIPPDKASLIFDGMHQEVIHRFTDVNLLLQARTLRVVAESSISLTFRNMIMVGRNYYGIPCIYEIVDTSGVSVTYQNVTYTGPQLVYNPNGLTCFENCDITIQAPNVNEVGEVCRVEFRGENIIRHNALTNTTKAVFWFRGAIGTAHLKAMEGARVTVNTTNYFMYNLIPVAPIPSIQNPVSYEVEPGASITLDTNRGISHDANHRAASFLVDRDASFRYTQQASNEGLHSLYINGDFTVNEGAEVYMEANHDDSSALINFPTGVAGKFVLDNPKSFVLYKPTSAPVLASGSTWHDFTINGGQLNHWTIPRALPDAGGFDDSPQNKWFNPDWSVFKVGGTVNAAQTNVTENTLIGPQPSLSIFQFQSARVLSVGHLPIIPDPVIDNGRPITGLSEPGADLIVSFTMEGVPYSFETRAGEDGKFEVDPEMALLSGTIVNIKANIPFLITSVDATVLPTGEVSILSAPEHIAFKTPPVSVNPVLLRRHDPEDKVRVLDSRPYPTQWKLKASISGPLRAASGETLENAVVFREDDGTLQDLSDIPIVVRTGGPVTGQVDVYWTVDKGVLVRVTQPICSGVEYLTQLIWSVEPV